MQTWTKILPFFIVEWLAKKHLERFTDWHGTGENKVFVYPCKGVKLFIGGDV